MNHGLIHLASHVARIVYEKVSVLSHRHQEQKKFFENAEACCQHLGVTTLYSGDDGLGFVFNYERESYTGTIFLHDANQGVASVSSPYKFSNGVPTALIRLIDKGTFNRRFCTWRLIKSDNGGPAHFSCFCEFATQSASSQYMANLVAELATEVQSFDRMLVMDGYAR